MQSLMVGRACSVEGLCLWHLECEPACSIPADQKQKQEVEPGIRHQVPPLSDPPISPN